MFIKRPQPDGTTIPISKLLPAVGPRLTKSKLTQIWHSPDEPIGAEGLRADHLFDSQLTIGGKAAGNRVWERFGAKVLPEEALWGLYHLIRTAYY